MNLKIINIYDILNIGESYFRSVVECFSSINPDIQDFLFNRAVEFAKLKQAVTYLVMSDEKLAGYFTLAVKTFEIKSTYISKTMSKKLSRVCALDVDNSCYRPPAILIAQIGKKFTYKHESIISGKELLQVAMEIILDIQYQAGGVITFLECENKKQLLDFYHDNGFKDISIRNTQDDKNLVQLYKLI